MDEYAIFYFTHLDRIIIVFTILAFCAHKAVLIYRKAGDSLNGAFLKSLTAAGIPNGLAFLICAIQPSYITHLQAATMAFALAGLALIGVSVKDLLRVYA